MRQCHSFRLGYLQARKEPGRTRERMVYELTDQGRAALAAGLGRRCISRSSFRPRLHGASRSSSTSNGERDARANRSEQKRLKSILELAS
jgi:DNA-binding PadR family transcriptional regulator